MTQFNLPYTAYDIRFTQNREISWLRFNERVLQEAIDPEVPLFERLKFISIFGSNLDEFFMIRVGSLYDLSLLKKVSIDNKSGLSAAEQLHLIFKNVRPLYKKRDAIFRHVENDLRQYGIFNLALKEIVHSEKKFVEDYFLNNIRPLLSPQIIDSHHPFPHLVSGALYIAIHLKDPSDNNIFGIVPIPHSLPLMIFLPGSNTRYLLMEKIILEYAHTLFETYVTEEKTIISVTRNADISPEDENYDVEEDYRHHMKKILKKRSRLAPVRLECQGTLGATLMNYLCSKIPIQKDQVFTCKTPLNTSYVFLLEDKIPKSTIERITYAPFEPQLPSGVNPNESMIKQCIKNDLLLSFPYEQMNFFLQLLKEAASDPSVITIKLTIYRLSSNSKLIKHLCTAAEMGKDVTVLLELRARFDEENNINWAETLEEAGCKVIYGMEGFKVHSKICLITRKDKGKIQYITQIGTGNYNEKTARMYSDFSLITADERIGIDAATFFQNMAISNLNGQYNTLLVAPNSFKSHLLRLIDKEIHKCRIGQQGRIILKLNSITDREFIDKLSEASCNGVKIDLIIRGICCILPGIKEKTENITITSIVGRFLEHHRIYVFGEKNEMQIYISSADMMTRNTSRRVEIACPVMDYSVKQRIYNNLEVMLMDNVKARLVTSEGAYAHKPSPNLKGEILDSQQYFIDAAIKSASFYTLQVKNQKDSIKKRFFKYVKSKL